MTDPQAAAIAFLADRTTHAGETPTRIDTHGSVVFLTSTHAYKLKRAVAYSYMDFATVDRRGAMCRRELAVNRRFAPELYETVLALCRGPDGRVRFRPGDDAAARDDVIDWVVRMRRFDSASQFDVLAATGQLDAALVRRLAATVARFHAAEAPVPGFGAAAGLRAVQAENRDECARFPDLLPPDIVAALDQGCGAALAVQAALLDRRAAAGHVRHCHGDLHLGNVCVFAGSPTPFDAIEFNDAIATIDTLFDLAFLLMDLELRAGRALANAALNAYLEILPETDGLAALPLMLALRAGIRAHTRAAAAIAQPAQGARTALAADAARHLAAGQAFLAPTAPRLVAIGGLSGSGKSTLAAGLAPEVHAASPGAVVLRSDVLRKELAGVAPEATLAPAFYASDWSARVYAMLFARAAAILRAGRGVVLDAVFQRPEERAAAAAVASVIGCRFDGIWLTADRATAAARIAARRGDASDATGAVLDAQLARGTPPPGDWTAIDARGERSQVLARARIAMSP